MTAYRGPLSYEVEKRRSDCAHLVDVAQYDIFDGRVFEDLANDTSVATSDDKDLFRIWVTC